MIKKKPKKTPKEKPEELKWYWRRETAPYLVTPSPETSKKRVKLASWVIELETQQN